MIAHLQPELYWLAATCLMTGLLWAPYVANRFRELSDRQGGNGSHRPIPHPLPRGPVVLCALI
jgi:hypothetical protein